MEDYSALDPTWHQKKIDLPVRRQLHGKKEKPKVYTLPLSPEDYREIIQIWNPKTEEWN